MRRIAFLAFLLIVGASTTAFTPSMGRSRPRAVEAEPNVAARFTATPMQPTCVAPCTVHFDATASTAVDYPGDISQVAFFEWTFGDPNSGIWELGSNAGASRNLDTGVIAGHLYNEPGTYTVVLRVTSPDRDSGSVTHTVTVADPDVFFAGTQTVCIAPSGTPGGAGFEDCPVQTAAQHLVLPPGADFNAALTGPVCNADSAKRRCLLRAGETYFASSTTTLTSAGTQGLIGRFGAGADPVIEGPSTNTTTLTVGSNWKFVGLNFHANHCQTAGAPTCGETLQQRQNQARVIGMSGTHDGVEFVRVRGTNHPQRFLSVGDGATQPQRFAFVDSYCEPNRSDGSDPGCFYLRADKYVFLGSTYNQIDSDYATRVISGDYAVLSHNDFLNARPGENALVLRPCADAGSVCGPNSTQGDHHVVVAWNRFTPQNTGGLGPIATCETSDCQSGHAAVGGLHQLIVEYNFFSASSGSTPSMSAAMISGQFRDSSIRYNVVDGQGITTAGTSGLVEMLPSDHGITQDRVRVMGNTFYTNVTGPRTYTICKGAVALANPSSNVCVGNLIDVRGLSGSKAVSDGANWGVTAGNVFSTSNPFARTPPGQGSSNFGDFKLAPASQAIGADTSAHASSTPFDARGLCRPAGAEWDAGAFECGPVDCEQPGMADLYTGVYEAGTELTPSQKAQILELRNGTWIGFGAFKNYSIGSPVGLAMGAANDALQAITTRPELVVQIRPDLYQKYRSDYAGTLTVGSSPTRYCAPGTPNNCSTWEGYLATCHGGINPGMRCVVGDSTCTGGGTCGDSSETFDTDWIMRVPIAEHNAVKSERWAALPDWFASSANWSSAVDWAAIAALATVTDVPALYASAQPDLFIGQVVMDLRIPAYRAFHIKQTIASLSDYGITGNDRVAIFWGYKPGWYINEPDAEADYNGCREAGDRTYVGYLWGATKPVGCGDDGQSQMLYDTQYGVGEYEAAVEAYISELIAALDAAGLTGVRFITQRAPVGFDSTLEDEVPTLAVSPRYLGRFSPNVAGPRCQF